MASPQLQMALTIKCCLYEGLGRHMKLCDKRLDDEEMT